MEHPYIREYTRLSGEIDALYHELAIKMGISDSVLNILYTICEKGDQCLQSELSKLSGINRQTINSAIRKLEMDGIVYLKQGHGRNTIVCLTEKGKEFSLERIYPILEIEKNIWNEWTAEEQQQYLMFTRQYHDALEKYIQMHHL